MAILDDAESYIYADPAWAGHSRWEFKLYQLTSDKAAISDLAYEYNVPRYTPKQIRDARRKHIDLAAEIENKPIDQTTKMNPRVAELAHMSLGWDGPEFVVPATFKARDAEGKVLLDEDGKPQLHELAGKLAPCTPEWIARLAPDQFERVYNTMSSIWEDGGETEDDFREAPGSVVEPSEPSVAEAPDAVPLGD